MMHNASMHASCSPSQASRAYPMLPSACIYALDPERAHVPLLLPSVPICILQRLLHTLSGYSNAVFASTPEPFGQLQHLQHKNKFETQDYACECYASSLSVTVRPTRVYVHSPPSLRKCKRATQQRRATDTVEAISRPAPVREVRANSVSQAVYIHTHAYLSAPEYPACKQPESVQLT